MDMPKLYELLAATTVQLRKGPAVSSQSVGPLLVFTIDDMPPTENAEDNPDIDIIDCFFLNIGVHKPSAAEHREQFIKICDTFDDPDVLAGGPSYITLGGIIGDQGAAFEFFALGKHYGLWHIVTPDTFGLKGVEAHEAAGGGFIMITGYKKEKEDGKGEISAQPDGGGEPAP
jgi:hypothetical protein